jgi:type I restriction enzyme S subunit
MVKITLPNGWKSIKLKNISEKRTAKNRDFTYSLVMTNSAQNGIIPQTEHFDKDIAVSENIDGYFIVNYGDYVYNPRISVTAPCGPIRKNHLGETGVMSPLYTAFKINNDKVDDKYVEYYFLSSAWYRYMKSIANYGARHDRMSITDEGFFSMPIPIPPLPEQQRIAEILTATDTLIATQEHLISAKQKQKRWLMQNLLTGKIRLPGFSGKWKNVKSREIFGTITDKSHSGQLQVLSATQDRGIVPRADVDIDIKFDEKALPTYKKVVPGNFVIHLRSFQGGLAYSKVEGIISPAYVILKPQIGICSNYYKQLFKSKNYIKRLNVAVYGIRDGKQISYESFGAIKIPYPPLPEQTAIAEILTTADKEIELLTKKLKQQKLIKKYLMQQLLTGKIRVKGVKGEN